MFIKNTPALLKASAPGSEAPRRLALALVEKALRASDPYSAVLRAVRRRGTRLLVGGVSIDLSRHRRVVVVGAGKASASMAAAVERLLGTRIGMGIVAVPAGLKPFNPLTRVNVIEAEHPFPDGRSIRAGQEILRAVSGLGRDDLVVSLFSGGGSALMCLPVEGISLEEKRSTTRLVSLSGATIEELNAVRKHLSRVKGGMLARAAHPARVLNLMVSDVVGDPHGVIASGPMAPDPSTFQEALRILEQRGVLEKAPGSVVDHLRKGAAGRVEETPKPGDAVFASVTSVVVASGTVALRAASALARSRGYRTTILTSSMEGEARHVGTFLGAVAQELSKQRAARGAVFMAGGETTVTVTGRGRGGRNQELALSACIKMRGSEGVALASVGSDGVDGVTDAAGALVDGGTYEALVKAGATPEEALRQNDSYAALLPAAALIFTGPTGTNVNDLVFITSARRGRARRLRAGSGSPLTTA